VFLGVISSSGPDKYYTCYLGGVIVSINNKLINNGDIPNNKIKVLLIAKSIFLLNIRETSRKLFFLEDNIRVYKEKILLELESNNKLALEELLSKVTGLGSCFNFFDFFFLLFLEGL
jgi:hypothetical protein